MAGENLTVQQRTFLEKYLKGGIFNRGRDKKVTKSYEDYLPIEQTFKNLMLEMPGKDPRVQQLGGKAGPAMKLKTDGKFEEAGAALTPLIGEARNLRLTFERELAAAAQRFRDALGVLAPDDATAMQLTQQMQPHFTSQIKDIPAAIVALDQAALAAGNRAEELRKAYPKAKTDYTDALKDLPTTDSRTGAITGRAGPAMTAADPDIPKAVTLLGTLAAACVALKKTIKGEKDALLRDLAKLADPAGASKHEKAAMKTLRDAATNAVAAEYPDPAAFATARKAMAQLSKQIATAAQIGKLPKATAEKTRTAMEGFDKVLGDLEITPQVVADATQRRQQAETAFERATQDLLDAQAMPDDTPEAKKLRTAAEKRATAAYNQAQKKLDTETQRSKAVLGKKYLSDAVTFGALAPDAGRPLDPAIATKFIEAFEKQPDIAQSALQLAKRAKDPGKLADALPMVCDKVGSRFEHGGIGFSSASYARDYGASLLAQGDFLGGDYFDGLKAYLDTGAHFAPSVVGNGNGKSERQRTADRSGAMAGALLDKDGKLDFGNPGAKTALAQMKFSPDAVINPTPVLTQHMMRTFEQLSTGQNATDAANLINGIAAPTDKAGKNIVGKSLGKPANSPITDVETRTAVLKALMTPMDQGPVGSCFTTAPTRRFRDEKPVEALRGLTEVATKGKFTSATGVKVPAVTEVPDGEDPLLRGWEYSIASAAATETGSRERTILGNNIKNNPGVKKIVALMGGTNPVALLAAQNAIDSEMRDAFNFQYNPTKAVKDANDGSSSTGRYQIVETDEFGAPTGAPIETPDQFVEVMTRRILAKLKVAPTSVQGKKITEHLKNDMLVTITPAPPQVPYKALPNGDMPWEMQSGGLGLGPTRALYGGGVATTETLGLPSTSPVPSEGERSKEVLLSVIAQAQANPGDDYLTIDSRGCHEYNALPKEPSLRALIGKTPQETKKNVEALEKRGQDIAAKALPLDRAQNLYERQTSLWIDRMSDPTKRQELIKAIEDNRPTAPVTPGELKTRITTANKVAMDAIAEQRGGTPQEIAERKVAFAEYSEGEALNELATDLAPPQVVYADTNWGDGGAHSYFVMMPDPTTGELRMWQRTDPPGDVKPMARKDWIDKRMHVTK